MNGWVLLSRANASHIPLPDGSVHMVCTSPPYWGLRNYGLPPMVWGGDAGCQRCFSLGDSQHTRSDPGGEGINRGRGFDELRSQQHGFCQRCGAWLGCLGLEPTPELYVEHLVIVFREVRRVLRNDGTVWLNLGDSYATGGGRVGRAPGGGEQGERWGKRWADVDDLTQPNRMPIDGLKPKDLCGIPWRVAFALQADGWYLRSDTVWAKGVSFCDGYSGSVMPESVAGWRWERHRIKIGRESADWNELPKGWDVGEGSHDTMPVGNYRQAESREATVVKWADCPGCPKCEANDGYVLRRGSWRPTRAHEYLFMLAKSERYFCDQEAVREASDSPLHKLISYHTPDHPKMDSVPHERYKDQFDTGRIWGQIGGRNPRSVWTINPQAYSGAHYATFPEALVEPCIKAGTSEAGVCPICGAPWARVVEPAPEYVQRLGNDWADYERDAEEGRGHSVSTQRCTKRNAPSLTAAYDTMGFRSICDHHDADPVPATVLDPFCGSGTTLVVARRLGRRGIGLDLSATYLRENARERLELDKLDAWGQGIEAGGESLLHLPLFAE